jgi:hypothetical protein
VKISKTNTIQKHLTIGELKEILNQFNDNLQVHYELDCFYDRVTLVVTKEEEVVAKYDL